MAHSKNGYQAFCKRVSRCEDKLTYGEQHLNPLLHKKLKQNLDAEISIEDASWLHHAMFTIAWRYLALTGQEFVANDSAAGQRMRTFLQRTRPYIFHHNWAGFQATPYGKEEPFSLALVVPTMADMQRKDSIGLDSTYCGQAPAQVPAGFTLTVHMGPLHLMLLACNEPRTGWASVVPGSMLVPPSGPFRIPAAGAGRPALHAEWKTSFARFMQQLTTATYRIVPTSAQMLKAKQENRVSEATMEASGHLVLAPGGRFRVLTDRPVTFELGHHQAIVSHTLPTEPVTVFHLLCPTDKSKPLHSHRLEVLVEIRAVSRDDCDVFLWLIVTRSAAGAGVSDLVIDLDPQMKHSPLFLHGPFCDSSRRFVWPKELELVHEQLKRWILDLDLASLGAK